MPERKKFGISAGTTVELRVNGDTILNYTVPDGEQVRVIADRLYFVPQGQTAEVLINGNPVYEETVPTQQVIVIRYEKHAWSDEP